MIIAFLDECGDDKRPKYLGLSLAVMNLSFYRKLKEETHKILRSAGWEPDTEFKGTFLFSESRGCKGVGVEKRVEATRQILHLTAAQKNNRMKFYYLRMDSDNQKVDYLKFVPMLLKKAFPASPSRKNGKDLVSIHCDHRDDVSIEDLRKMISPILIDKGYALFEDIFSVSSHFETVGILFADIVGYLLARIDTISEDKELFESIPAEHLATNGKLRKLNSSRELVGLVRDIKKFAVEVKKT